MRLRARRGLAGAGGSAGTGRRSGAGDDGEGERGTSQAVDGPLLELLERDLSRRRDLVEAQAVRVVVRLEGRLGELLLPVVEGAAALGVDAVAVVGQHRGRRWVGATMRSGESKQC